MIQQQQQQQKTHRNANNHMVTNKVNLSITIFNIVLNF